MQIDYYQGAYGPTLRLWTEDPDDLVKFAMICKRVLQGRCEEVELLSSLGLTHCKLTTITMGVDNRIDRFEGIISVEKKGKRIAMHWLESLEGWDVSIERLLNLSQARIPSHQYLADGRDSDVLIEVSYLE